MEFDNKLLLIISIASLIFTNSFRGFHFSPTASQENEIEDELKETFGPIFDEAKEALSPDSSLDLDKVEEAFSPSLDEAKEASGPVSSWDEAKEASGPVSSWDEAKEAFGPVSSSIVDDAKKALSPSTIDEAKENFGPESSKVIDKAKKELDSIASWISQNKEDISFEAQNQLDLIPSPKLDKAKKTISSPNNEAGEAPIPSLPLASYELLDEDKQKLRSPGSIITQNKEEIAHDLSSILAEAQKELGPITYSNLDVSSKDAPAPVSSSTSDEAKEDVSSDTSLISQNKEEVSSDSPSESPKELGPTSSLDENAPSSSQSPTPAPNSPSTLAKAKDVIGSYSYKAIDAAKEEFGSISSFFSQNKVQLTSKSNIHHPHSLSLYFDQDTALAIESLIMKAQSNSHLAIEETKKLLSDTTIASSESGKCMQKCMKNYESCIRSLTKAMEDLNGRNADLLVEDVSAVDGEISSCQKCVLDNKETQSPLKDLEADIVKAAQECLSVLDHSD